MKGECPDDMARMSARQGFRLPSRHPPGQGLCPQPSQTQRFRRGGKELPSGSIPPGWFWASPSPALTIARRPRPGDAAHRETRGQGANGLTWKVAQPPVLAWERIQPEPPSSSPQATWLQPAGSEPTAPTPVALLGAGMGPWSVHEDGDLLPQERFKPLCPKPQSPALSRGTCALLVAVQSQGGQAQ